jgi:hypothetical protein
MIGTTATEMTMLIGASDAATWTKPEGADRLISAFRADRPEALPSDLFFAIATAASFRKGAWDSG